MDSIPHVYVGAGVQASRGSNSTPSALSEHATEPTEPKDQSCLFINMCNQKVKKKTQIHLNDLNYHADHRSRDSTVDTRVPSMYFRHKQMAAGQVVDKSGVEEQNPAC